MGFAVIQAGKSHPKSSLQARTRPKSQRIAGECRLGCLPLETIILDIWIWHGHILGMAKLFEGFRTGRACECHALQMAVPGTKQPLILLTIRG